MVLSCFVDEEGVLQKCPDEIPNRMKNRIDSMPAYLQDPKVAVDCMENADLRLKKHILKNLSYEKLSFEQAAFLLKNCPELDVAHWDEVLSKLSSHFTDSAGHVDLDQLFVKNKAFDDESAVEFVEEMSPEVLQHLVTNKGVFSLEFVKKIMGSTEFSYISSSCQEIETVMRDLLNDANSTEASA